MMFKRTLSLILLLIIVLSTLSVAQRRDRKPRRDWDDFDEIEWLNIDRHAEPMIEVNYGKPNFKHKSFSGEFAKSGMIGIRLGYSSTYSFYEDYLMEREDNYLFVDHLSSEMASEQPLDSEFDNSLWVFGIGRRDGLGYDLDEVEVIPYTETNILWSRLKIENTPNFMSHDTTQIAMHNYDVSTINLYNEAFRFGTSNEVGMRVNVASFLDISGGYQFTSVLPRFLTWKQLGSYSIEIAGMAMLDEFIHEITDSSPAAGPLMGALLKGAYMFAFYKLKSEKMAWPFTSESPLTYESFKVGMTLTF